MAPFARVLEHAQAAAIRDYVIHRANAADTPNAGKAARQPDVSHGALIVARGTAAGAPACAQCHAFTGASDASGAFPRLAGQPSSYLFAGSCRTSSRARAQTLSCRRIARALSLDDAADVSAYFASLDTPFPLLEAADSNLVRQEKEFADAGIRRGAFPLAVHVMA